MREKILAEGLAVLIKPKTIMKTILHTGKRQAIHIMLQLYGNKKDIGESIYLSGTKISIQAGVFRL